MSGGHFMGLSRDDDAPKKELDTYTQLCRQILDALETNRMDIRTEIGKRRPASHIPMLDERMQTLHMHLSLLERGDFKKEVEDALSNTPRQAKRLYLEHGERIADARPLHEALSPYLKVAKELREISQIQNPFIGRKASRDGSLHTTIEKLPENLHEIIKESLKNGP